MFCKKCGAALNDAAMFCEKCGASVNESDNVNKTEKSGKTETIVLQVSKSDEEITINRYRCFGWVLINNQEVNITSVHGGAANGSTGSMVTSSTETYVKLTFERNNGMNNFEILDGYYVRYTELESKKEEILKPLAKLFVKWFLIVGAIVAVIGTIVSFSNEYFGLIMFGFCALPLALISGAMAGLIAQTLGRKIMLKQLSPKLAPLELQMDRLADEASKYL